MHRFGRYAAALCVGVWVIALVGYVVHADVPQVPTGTWMSGGAFGEIPRDAASAVLPDGRLVVAGGSDRDGKAVDLIAIYDPASGAWERAGQMTEARAGHTATALADGRVLITGGRTSNGVTFSAELYDPTAGASTPAGDLSLPRTDHAAARLIDGRVLIVGGSDGVSALALAEIFDPATGSVASLSVSLATPRMRLSATTLLDGHVLIAGGNDGTQDLASAEIFDADLGIFWATSSLRTPRSGHLAVLLAHNNTVLIAGGTSHGAAVASVERFAHWNETFLAESSSMAGARSGAVSVPTARDGVVLVGGGGRAEAELYGFATLKTDKDDYAPGEIVTISGTGWQPGETVHLTVSEYADTHYDFEYTAVADDSGNIVNREFHPREDETYHHMGMRFYVMAQGIASEAQTTFTDAGTLTITFGGNGSGSVSGEGAGHQPADFAACTSTAGGCSLEYKSSGNVDLTATPASGSTFTGWSGECTGAGTCTVKMDENKSITATFEAINTSMDQTITFGPLADRTYGDGDFAATATASSGLPVTFTVSGPCTIAGVTVHISGSGACTVTAHQAGNANYNPAQDVSQTFAIARATPVVTVNGGTYTYDGARHAATARAEGVGGVSVAGTFDFTYNAVAQEPVNAGTYAVVATFTSTEANYTNATGTAMVTITKADADIQVDGGTFTYDGHEKGATGTAKGVAGADLTALLDLGAKFVNVPGGPANWSFAGDMNYNATSGAVDIIITKANADVEVTGGTYTYDGQEKGAHGRAASVTGQDLSSLLDLGAKFVNVPGGTANWSFPGDANHNATSGAVDIIITKANADVEVTGGTYTYDGHEKGAHGRATSVTGQDLSSLLDLGAKFVNVPGGTATWSFPGDANHNATSGTVAIVIEQATPTVTVTGGTYTYDGAAHPASAAATGVNGIGVAGTFSLAYNGFAAAPANAGTYAVVASFTSADVNYANAMGTGSILIQKASQSIVVTTPAPAQMLYNTSFTVAAVGGGSGNRVTFSAAGSCTNSGATFTLTSGYGTCTVTFNQAGNDNYHTADAVVQSVAATPWRISGFYSPVTPSAPGSPIWNVVKGGSTVPLKFEIFAGVDGPEVTAVSAVQMSLQQVNCWGGAVVDVPADQLVDAGGTSLRHDGGQFIQNWKAPKTPGSCLMVSMRAADTSTISAYFQVK